MFDINKLDDFIKISNLGEGLSVVLFKDEDFVQVGQVMEDNFYYQINNISEFIVEIKKSKYGNYFVNFQDLNMRNLEEWKSFLPKFKDKNVFVDQGEDEESLVLDLSKTKLLLLINEKDKSFLQDGVINLANMVFTNGK